MRHVQHMLKLWLFFVDGTFAELTLVQNMQICESKQGPEREFADLCAGMLLAGWAGCGPCGGGPPHTG